MIVEERSRLDRARIPWVGRGLRSGTSTSSGFRELGECRDLGKHQFEQFGRKMALDQLEGLGKEGFDLLGLEADLGERFHQFADVLCAAAEHFPREATD